MNTKLLATYEALDAKAEARLTRQMRRAMRRIGSQYCVGAVGYRNRYYVKRSEAVKRYRLLKRRGEHPFLTSIAFGVTVRFTPPPVVRADLRQLMMMKMMQPLRPSTPLLRDDRVPRALITHKTRELLGCRIQALPAPENTRVPYAVML